MTLIGPSALTLTALMFAGCGGGAGSNPSSATTSNPSSADVTAPAITTHPASQEVTAGSTATFSVANTGTAPILYQWWKNGTAIIGATSSSYTTPATSASDNGSKIDVVVSNSAGKATSNPATLTVKAGKLALDASTTSLSFGTVNVSSNTMRSVTLTNTGTATVTILYVEASGPGFTASGVATGTFLSPGQSATLDATFAPAASGNVPGSITVKSTASSEAIVIALSGTGADPVAHTVTLSWSASVSAAVTYNVYFRTASGDPYVKLNSNPVAGLSYQDSDLKTAQTRYYVVTSVDSKGDNSAFSSDAEAIIP